MTKRKKSASTRRAPKRAPKPPVEKTANPPKHVWVVDGQAFLLQKDAEWYAKKEAWTPAVVDYVLADTVAPAPVINHIPPGGTRPYTDREQVNLAAEAANQSGYDLKEYSIYQVINHMRLSLDNARDELLSLRTQAKRKRK